MARIFAKTIIIRIKVRLTYSLIHLDKSTIWQFCTKFGRGFRVNGENSYRIKLLYVYNKWLGSANKRTSQTLTIEWKKTSGVGILRAFEFIKPLVVEKTLLSNKLKEDGKLNSLEKQWNNLIKVRMMNIISTVSGKACKLLPLIKFGQSPSKDDNACYFYK